MPRRFERHRRSKWEWGLPPARSDEVRKAASPDPEPATRAPAQKDTRRWCRGKEGREHVPEITYHPPPFSRPDNGCRWRPRWTYDGITWDCHHREECTGCGKILREGSRFPAAECPAYPGTGDQRAAAETEAAEALQRQTERHQSRKRVIAGPQGYRRPRPD